MAKILAEDNLVLLKEKDGERYYLFRPRLLQLYPKSGNMRNMTLLQTLRFLGMYLAGCRVYILATEQEKVLGSITFSAGGTYRYPFSTKKDIIYGPSYTLPEYRGQGVAVRICGTVLEEFEKDYCAVYGTVAADNQASLRAMGKSGFDRVCYLSANKLTRAFRVDEMGALVLMRYTKII